MADNNVFSVRLEEQDKDKLLQMIQESGRSNKEFMSVLLSAYELNKAKVEIPDIAKDIEGLQALTQRINEYYVNIGKRIEDTQRAKDLQYTKDIETYKARIDTLKEDNLRLNEELENTTQEFNSALNETSDYKRQLQQAEEIQESNKALIQEYKEKNDTLAGLLNEYKGYKEQMQTVQELLSQQQADNIKLKDAIEDKGKEIQALNNATQSQAEAFKKQLEDRDRVHQGELDRVQQQAELNKDKAVLELQREHQAEMQQTINNFNNRILEYQKQIEDLSLKFKDAVEEIQKSKTKKANNVNK